MHSDLPVCGKAILTWPFLFLALETCLLAYPGSDHSKASGLPADSGTYSRTIRFEDSEREIAWKKAVEYADALKLPEKVENKAVVDELNRKINTMFGFYLYKQAAFLKQVDGAVMAELDISFEADTMVAIIQNIYFIRYARDRYGKFSPRSSRKYPYGDLINKQKGESWLNHFKTIDEKMNLLLVELQKSVQEEKEASNR